MFEWTVAEIEADRIVARIAEGAHDRGISPAEILVEIEKTTGAAPDHPPMRHLCNRAASKEWCYPILERHNGLEVSVRTSRSNGQL
jgi:hypothetical protein